MLWPREPISTKYTVSIIRIKPTSAQEEDSRIYYTGRERWQKGAFFNLARSKSFYTDKLGFISSSVHLILRGIILHTRKVILAKRWTSTWPSQTPGTQLCRWGYLLSQHGYRLKFLAIYLSSYRVIRAQNNSSRQSIYKRRNAHRTQCAGALGALSTYSFT
jgi:hypothetical protein